MTLVLLSLESHFPFLKETVPPSRNFRQLVTIFGIWSRSFDVAGAFAVGSDKCRQR